MSNKLFCFPSSTLRSWLWRINSTLNLVKVPRGGQKSADTYTKHERNIKVIYFLFSTIFKQIRANTKHIPTKHKAFRGVTLNTLLFLNCIVSDASGYGTLFNRIM